LLDAFSPFRARVGVNTTWAPGAWLVKGAHAEGLKAKPLELDELLDELELEEELLLDELELEEELLLEEELELDELELEEPLVLLDLLLPQPVRLRAAMAQAKRARR